MSGTGTIESIELEFGEPFKEVFLGMRQQGCTLDEIAACFEMSRARLYQFRKQIGLEREARTRFDKKSRVDCVARELGYSDASSAILDMRWSGMTVERVAQILKCDPRTVRRHYPAGLSGEVFIKTPKYFSSRRKTKTNWT